MKINDVEVKILQLVQEGLHHIQGMRLPQLATFLKRAEHESVTDMEISSETVNDIKEEIEEIYEDILSIKRLVNTLGEKK